MMTRAALLRTAEENGFEVDFGVAAPEEAIRALQSRFEFPIPSDYLEFLRELGTLSICSNEIMGVSRQTHLDVCSALSFEREKAGLQYYLLPLREDGFGNLDCIDLSKSTVSASCVIEWRHEDRQPSRKIAESLEEWLNEIISFARKF